MAMIRSYRDLTVWQVSRELVLVCYQTVKALPPDEKFALTSQIKRSAVSVPANIAEGFGRSAVRDREHFYVVARGSLYELDTHMQIAYDLDYITADTHKLFSKKFEDAVRLLSAFIKSHQSQST